MGSGGARQALRHRDFARFFWAAAISNAGAWMQIVALPAILFDLTDSATWLGVSTVASMLPAVILTPYAGVLADRISRRKILIVTQSVQMVLAFGLFGWYATGTLNPWGIVGCGFIGGCATGIQTAAWQSFVPLLVPRQLLLEAVKLNSAQYTLARALGPAVAGALVKLSGPGLALFVDAVTFVLVIAALVMSRPRVVTSRPLEGSVWAIMRGGASFVWRHRPLRLAMAIAFVGAVCGQAMQFMAAAVSERVFGHPSTDNAGLLVALGCGAVVSWLFFQWSADMIRRSVRLAATLALYAASIAVIASTRHYAVGIVGYTLNGLAHVQLAMSLNTLIQGSVPDHVRGRTTSFYVLGLLAGIPIGSFAIGRLADVIGMRPALLIDAAVFGAFGVFLVVTGRLRLMDVARVGDHPDEGAELITAPGLAT
jgi:MFS family permease